MNQFQEQFYQMMTRMRENSRSRVASTSTSTSTPFQEPREWYLDKNGVVVSKPIESKGASVSVTPQGINVNKLKAIHDFIRSNGRV